MITLKDGTPIKLGEYIIEARECLLYEDDDLVPVLEYCQRAEEQNPFLGDITNRLRQIELGLKWTLYVEEFNYVAHEDDTV